MKIDFSDIEQKLLENMADFLDEWYVVDFETSNNLCDPESRESSELHIRMAKAALREYKKTMKPTGNL